MSSETNEINFNPFIDRLVDMLRASILLFPKSVGDDNDATDLIKQVVKYNIPIPQDVPTGEGPPHVIVRLADNPIVEDKEAGRDERNVKGPRDVELEFWVICIVNEVDFQTSQQSLFNITNAVSQTIGKNKRLQNSDGLDPLCRDVSYVTTPFTNIQSTQKTVMARTVVIRPKVPVNLRVLS